MIFPPGTILQRMYLREQLQRRVPGRFLEVGCGAGWNSQILLSLGWSGMGIDLHEPSALRAAETNSRFVQGGRYQTLCCDFLTEPRLNEYKFDIIISCMVIEHLDDTNEAAYFHRCRELLAPGGSAIVLVPASMKHWGIEDQTAGHFRRYSLKHLDERLRELGWKSIQMSGLTYPLSNWLLRLSNYLVARNDKQKLNLSIDERTKLSGARSVAMKDKFPSALSVILNEPVMTPFHLAQKWFGRNSNCMVLYAECTPEGV